MHCRNILKISEMYNENKIKKIKIVLEKKEHIYIYLFN